MTDEPRHADAADEAQHASSLRAGAETQRETDLRAADEAMPVMAGDEQRSRGRYVYTRDGAPVGVDERFVLGTIAPGVTRVRSTRISASPTSRLEVDVRVTGGDSHALVRWVGSGPGIARSARAEYVATGSEVVVTREVDGVVHSEARVRGALYPLMRVFTGPLVVASVPGLELVVPDVSDPGDLDGFLAPVTSVAHRRGARRALGGRRRHHADGHGLPLGGRSLRRGRRGVRRRRGRPAAGVRRHPAQRPLGGRPRGGHRAVGAPLSPRLTPG